MYGAIGRGIWNKEYWGEQSDDFQSNLFYDDTLKDLKKVASEHYPALRRIRERERDAEQLYLSNPLKEGDDDYEPGYTITLEHRLQQGEEANLLKKNETDAYTENLREAIGWREKSDEIKKLEEELQEARNAMYRARKGKTDEERETYNQNRTKAYEAEQSLEDAKEWALTRYTNRTQKDYNLRSDLESFLSDIAFHHQWFRERLYPDEQIKEFIQKYLENPSWHLPQITDFLLIDLIDSDLIRLEEDFHLGLFSSNIANQLGGPNSYFDGSFLVISSNIHTLPTLSPESKRKRSRWRNRNFFIGAGLIFFSILAMSGELEPWISKDLLHWIGPAISTFGFYFIFSVLYSIVGEAINKRRIDIKNLHSNAHTLLNIRWDILSGIYDAKTCIERLKRIDEPLHISSLVYPLLELQKRLQTLP